MAMLDGLYFVPKRDFSTPVHHISIYDSCTILIKQTIIMNRKTSTVDFGTFALFLFITY